MSPICASNLARSTSSADIPAYRNGIVSRTCRRDRHGRFPGPPGLVATQPREPERQGGRNRPPRALLDLPRRRRDEPRRQLGTPQHPVPRGGQEGEARRRHLRERDRRMEAQGGGRGDARCARDARPGCPGRGDPGEGSVEPVSFELPWPPSLNRYYRHVGPRVLISREGRQYRMKTVSRLGGAFPKFTASVRLKAELFPPDKRRRDIDNSL